MTASEDPCYIGSAVLCCCIKIAIAVGEGLGRFTQSIEHAPQNREAWVQIPGQSASSRSHSRLLHCTQQARVSWSNEYHGVIIMERVKNNKRKYKNRNIRRKL